MYGLMPKGELEHAVLSDPIYMASLDVGKVRKNHPEAEYGHHVRKVLEFVDDNFSGSEFYSELRLVAMLHDVGKLGDLTEKRMPDCSPIKKEWLADRSEWFQVEYDPMEEYDVDIHAQYSHEYAKVNLEGKWAYAAKDIDVSLVLDLVLEHDMAYDAFHEGVDLEEFRKRFSGRSEDWYDAMVKFVTADQAGRNEELAEWFADMVEKV